MTFAHGWQPKPRCKGMAMPTDNKKPTGDGNPPAGHTDGQILLDAERIGNPEKHFATLRAAFALQGHRLERTFHGVNLEPTYYAERWGMVRHLPTLEDARRFLAQIGGKK